MPNALNEDQWRDVLRLVEEVADLPEHEREHILSSTHPDVAREVWELVGQASQPAPPPVVPGSIGRFVITGKLGQGGMGEVFAAEDTELKRTVAIKFLAPEILARPEAAQRFIREAQIASGFNHPNIVTIYEVIRNESMAAIVMELVDGKALRRLCAEPPPLRQSLQITRQIAGALDAAHQRGIVHRDIKPENIILRPDGCVKVLDFGLARQVPASGIYSNASLLAGTLRYMSPEQARGEAVTAASDIFSFGLVLHELLTGRHPFPGASPLESAHSILTQPPVMQPLPEGEMPPALRTLILSMLAKKPADRPTAAQVLQKLDEAAYATAHPHPGPSSPKRRRWLAIAAAAVCLASVAALLLRSGRSTEEFTDLTIKPLTSQSGWEGGPALSPDGSSVAFTWAARLDQPKEVFVKRPNDAEPVKLTNSTSGNIGYLVWSPDASRIAFKRQFAKVGGIYSIAASGGDERKVADLANANMSSAIDWSPDGGYLAFSDSLPGAPDQLAIFLYNVQTGEKRKLTSPPPQDWGDWNPKFSPDGETIAFKRVKGFWADDMYLVPVAGGPAKQITSMRRGIWGHAWTPDGKSLIISCQRNSTTFGIWRFPLQSPGQPERIVQGSADAIAPATSRHARRLAWVSQIWDLNIYRTPASGNGPAERLVASTQRDQAPTYSPDGRIALISDRSGSREIWIARGDGTGQTQATRFNGPQIDHLQWSFDGQYLAFDSRPSGLSEVFIMRCPKGMLQCEEPKRLAGLAPAEAPGWSADGASLYFASNRGGAWQIWKQSLAGGAAVQVTRAGGYACRESADGKWLYFGRRSGHMILRMPGSKPGKAAVGEETLIGPPYEAQNEGWDLSAREIVFIDRPKANQPAAIRALSIDTGKVRTVLELSEVFLDRGDVSVSVSPDGRWIAYAQLDRSGSNVMIADGTR